MADIQHVFVLMMENRSFDHLFGFSALPGISPPHPDWGMMPGAPDRAPLDPPHEFENVRDQIDGNPAMSGFRAQSCWNVSGKGFGSDALPVLRTLAEHFFLFDNWYASMPGPTWPNRFFVHAGSSGGLDNSPSNPTTIESETVDSLGFTFPNRTLFQRLEDAGRTWRVYHDDLFPQVLAIQGMIDPFRVNDEHFSWIRTGTNECFVNDVNDHYAIDYTFIEPNYGLSTNNFADGNSQHPTGSMAAGEAFIKYIYESIRRSPVWPTSLLLITYDEHGGFFDHCPPPAAAPPADGIQNQSRAQNSPHFAFDRLGVRVPAVAISPWIRKGGLGSQAFPGKTFDHTAIIKTVLTLFSVPGPITARDEAADRFDDICELADMRTDAQDVPETLPEPLMAPSPGATAPASDAAVPDGLTNGFSRIAMSLDLRMQAQAPALPPVALAHPTFTTSSARGPHAVGATPDDPASHGVPAARTRQQALDYIQAVAARLAQTRGSPPR